MQIYYLSSTNTDETDDCCERLGWKKWQEYNRDQRTWKYLSTLAEGNARQEDNLPFEDEPEDEDYYPSLPFAALFSCFKVIIFKKHNQLESMCQHLYDVLYNMVYLAFKLDSYFKSSFCFE